MGRTLQVRLADDVYARLESDAEAAGLPVAELARRKLFAEPPRDGRLTRWEKLREHITDILRDEDGCDALIARCSHDNRVSSIDVAFAMVTLQLGLERPLTPQEKGIVRQIASVELQNRMRKCGMIRD